MAARWSPKPQVKVQIFRLLYDPVAEWLIAAVCKTVYHGFESHRDLFILVYPIFIRSLIGKITRIPGRCRVDDLSKEEMQVRVLSYDFILAS